MATMFIGQMTGFAGNFAPRKWVFTQGQKMPIDQNQHLFALLGTNFGGDGRKTFKLPDTRGRSLIGSGNLENEHGYALGTEAGLTEFFVEGDNLPHEAVKISGPTMKGRARGHVNASRSLPDTPSPEDAQYATFADGLVTYTLTSNDTDQKLGDVEIDEFEVEFQGKTDFLGEGEPVGHRGPYVAINWIMLQAGFFPIRS